MYTRENTSQSGESVPIYIIIYIYVYVCVNIYIFITIIKYLEYAIVQPFGYPRKNGIFEVIFIE